MKLTIEQAVDRVERAKIRYDRAVKRLYTLYGWGTHEELEKARKSVKNAGDYLELAETKLRRAKREEV